MDIDYQRLKRALLMELYAWNNSHEARPNDMYEKLYEYFERELKDQDFEPYFGNNSSRWENKIQNIRAEYVKENLILSAKEYKHGIWKLSEPGVKKGRELYIDSYGEDPWNEETTESQNLSDTIVEELKEKDESELFPEGKESYKLHRTKERNSRLVALKKKKAYEVNSKLPCEICGFSFCEKYGDIGEKFIEAHHITPLAELKNESETKLSDLVLLCSNCHKMIHRKRPWLSTSEIKNLLMK